MSALSPSFLASLRNIVDERGLVAAPADIAPYLHETRALMVGEAGAVLRPRDTAEVAALMRLAREAGVPVVVQGGNTGLVGGGVPFGGIVISLQRLNRIRAVDPVNATMTVEAGVVLKAVQDAAAAVDRLYPLTLASEGSCTIGGNIATNAGGTAVLRYGNTRDLVLGLEVVLPNGDIWNGLSGLRKDNAGYDLKHLFIGSEGTLGIVTAAVVKLFPRPRSRIAGFAGAAAPGDVVTLFDRLRNAVGDKLTTFEILPRFGIEVVLRHGKGARDPLAEPHLFYAFFELTTPEADAPLEEQVMTVLEGALEAGEIADATLSANEAQALAFWGIREGLAEYQKHEGASIKHDVSVPISRIADFMVEAQAACEAKLPGIRVCGFGHIGDGNLHYNLSQPIGMDPRAFLAMWHDFNDIVHGLVHQRGGSIAAEHGVGLMKRDELRHFKDPVQLALMATIKRALDPDNLLNPGKVIAIGNNLPQFRPAG
jgi:FAD/FMN-containing dehydrogenase